MMRFILAAAILALVSVSAFAETAARPARAIIDMNGPHNDTPIPAGLQGLWSAPDCTAAQQMFVISPHYELFYRPDIFRLGAIQSWRQEEDEGDTLYQLRTNMNNPMLLKKTNDGLMKIRLLDVNPKAPLRSAWGLLDDQTAPEFAHCAKLFDSGTSLGQDEVNTIFLLDAAWKDCKDVLKENFSSAAACHKALFDISDSDKNETLDHTELTRIYRQVAFALSASNYCGGRGYPENAPAEAEDFATSVLGTKKAITYDQVITILGTPSQLEDRVLTFVENARSLQLLMPFLPLATVMKTCALIEPANQKNLGTVLLPETVPSNP